MGAVTYRYSITGQGTGDVASYVQTSYMQSQGRDDHLFDDIKGSLYRSEVENVIEQLCSKMGPVVTEDGCEAKQPAQNDELNDDDDGQLNISDNPSEQFDDDEHDAAFEISRRPSNLTEFHLIIVRNVIR